MRDSFVNCDTAEDSRLTLQVNGETWTVCPEPDQMMAFASALVALRRAVAEGTLPAEGVAPATARLLRDHLLSPEQRTQYDACGTGKKCAVVQALWETFVGSPVDPDPTNGRSAPTAPPAGDSTDSPDSAAPPAGLSMPPSRETRPASDGTSTKPSPRPPAMSQSSSPSCGTAAVQTPPNASMSFSSSAPSAGSE